MMPPLPEPFEDLLRPLFEALPVNAAMARLVPDEPAGGEVHSRVERIIADAQLRDRPELAAGLWLYADDLGASHRVSQSIQTPTGAFWHAIMHRREGDFSNAKYWYRQAGTHPVLRRIDTAGGSAGAGTDVGRFDPFAFADAVAAAHRKRRDATDLVDLQRREWVALFHYSIETAGV